MAKPVPANILQETLDAVAKYGTATKAAKALGVPRTTIISRMNSTPYRPEVATPQAASEVDVLRDQVTELTARLKAVKPNTLDEEYVKRKIIGLALEAETPAIPTWMVSQLRGKALPGCPIAFWSDWHWGEVVFPNQVNGVNEFNMEIARARARRLVERTIKLLTHHVVNPDYPGLVLALGGDMVTGDIHEELTNTNDAPVLPTLLDLLGVLVWAIRELKAVFKKLYIPCVAGNHGRLTRKPQAKNRAFTNYDWLLYQLLAKHFESDHDITFYIPEGTDALFSVYGHKYLLTHGDQFRGGDGIIGAIGPITRGNQRKLARNSSINRDYDTMMIGHWHQWMPLHRTIVNGSLKGYDEYANVNNFGFEPPIQGVWLTHPEHGIIMTMPVYLEPHPGRGDGAPWVQWKDAA